MYLSYMLKEDSSENGAPAENQRDGANQQYGHVKGQTVVALR